ncbi:hypothetical protein [Nocardioides sp. NPDC006273]|uniref:hypothetical protein n=1 Tax=Nocardioides sp. NPDC006273 TaxID=3155598 RepID=UPI0033B45CAD
MTRRLVAVLLAAFLVSGCVPASPDVDTYGDEALRTAGTAVSHVRTVERVLNLLHEQRMLRPTAITQLRYSEDGLGTTTTSFSELNPPLASDPLADRLGGLLDRAEQLVMDARVTVERRAVEDYADVARQLESTAKKLEAVEAGLS